MDDTDPQSVQTVQDPLGESFVVRAALRHPGSMLPWSGPATQGARSGQACFRSVEHEWSRGLRPRRRASDCDEVEAVTLQVPPWVSKTSPATSPGFPRC